MHLRIAVLALAAAAATACSSPGGPAEAGDLRAKVDDAIERVYPALVRVNVVTVVYQGGRAQKTQGSGSGTIITADGHVVTNHHVSGRATHITCTLSSREEIPATLLGTDPLSDISVLKLDLAKRKDPGAPVRAAAFGDSDGLRVGDRVLAMGSPMALSQSVTLGIVSNLDMMIPRMFEAWGSALSIDGEDVGSLVKWVGHDAQIFPGNSGGPLVDLKGEIVGVNEIGLGLSGAIPGNLARKVAFDIIRHGQVRRSWTGLELQPLLKTSADDRGVLVGGVIEGSPADKAGIRAGDVLLTYDGRPLSVRFREQLPLVNRLLMDTPVGAAVNVTVRRGAEERRFAFETVERSRVQGREVELREWGMTARELTALAALELRRAPHTGVLVSSLREGGPSSDAKPPLRDGDIVVAVEGREIKDPESLARVTRDLLGDKNSPVPALVTVDRKHERILTVVQLGVPPETRWNEASKPWLGAGIQVLTRPLAQRLGLAGKSGVRITQIFPGASADKAGLAVGDLLIALDGDPIPASRPEDIQVLSHMLRQRKIGTRVRFRLVREGQERDLELELAAQPAQAEELDSYKNPDFEFTAREMSYQDRIANPWPPEAQGAVVHSVSPGGWAAVAHLKAGDLVLAVDAAPTPDVKALEAALKDVARRRPAHIVFHVRRGIRTLFVELEPAWPDEAGAETPR